MGAEHTNIITNLIQEHMIYCIVGTNKGMKRDSKRKKTKKNKPTRPMTSTGTKREAKGWAIIRRIPRHSHGNDDAVAPVFRPQSVTLVPDGSWPSPHQRTEREETETQTKKQMEERE